MVSRCPSTRKRKNQSTTATHHERRLASHSAQFLAALFPKSTATFSKKRKCPCSESPDQPHPKRAPLSRIPLPSPPLNRTLSGPTPITSPVISNPDRQSPSSSQQPLPRCISEPVPECYLPAATPTPTKPPRIRDPSPDALRAKRMLEKMIQMSKQWDEIIKKSEEKEDAESQSNDQFAHKGDSEASEGSETAGSGQESVWVEMNGELLTLHLKCPCTKGYQILLSGDECYYRAASF